MHAGGGVTTLTRMPRAAVDVYVTTYCPYCVTAKMLLKKKGVAFKEHDVTRDPAKRAWLVEATGRKTVPQIFINGRPVGGSDDLHALDKRGELDALLDEPPAAPPPPSEPSDPAPGAA